MKAGNGAKYFLIFFFIHSAFVSRKQHLQYDPYISTLYCELKWNDGQHKYLISPHSCLQCALHSGIRWPLWRQYDEVSYLPRDSERLNTPWSPEFSHCQPIKYYLNHRSFLNPHHQGLMLFSDLNFPWTYFEWENELRAFIKLVWFPGVFQIDHSHVRAGLLALNYPLFLPTYSWIQEERHPVEFT